ncbi:MAG: DUF1566 domain-containing protein [Deltaproteobacteria bacterium]|nr:DUF1566 domain-containing protein [Deltaproteobacteria bacterium]
MRSILLVLVFAASIPTFAACAADDDSASDAGTDTDTDTDSDSDSDTDDPNCPNPGIEQDGAGLIWQQCLAGQCFEEHPESGVEECMGEALELEWEEVSAACYTGWRPPTHEELMALLGNCSEIDTDLDQADCDSCPESAVCDEMFPGIEDLPPVSRLHLHWSSTEFDETNAWFARFQGGTVRKDSKTKKYTLHCVREAD